MTRKKSAIYLEVEQIEEIQRLSKLTRVPQSAYIREAIDDLLAKYRDVLQKKTFIVGTAALAAKSTKRKSDH